MINQNSFWNALMGGAFGGQPPSANSMSSSRFAGLDLNSRQPIQSGASGISGFAYPAGGGLSLDSAGAAGGGLRLGGAGANGAGFAVRAGPGIPIQASNFWDDLTKLGKDALAGFDEHASTAAKAMDFASKSGGLLSHGDFEAPPMTPVDANPNAFLGLLSPTDQVDLGRRLKVQQDAVFGLLGGYAAINKPTR